MNFIINLINFFRVKKKLKQLNLHFFSDGVVKNLENVENLNLKKKIAEEILRFNKNCDLFYNNIDVNEKLKPSGLWKDYFIKNKKEQIEVYNKANINEIILLHENMFYNSLLRGLWNYTHFENIKKDHSSIMLFLKDLSLYNIIFSGYFGLSSSNKLRKWGYKAKSEKFHFLDISSKLQNYHILNSLNLLKQKKKFDILEIGGGFGSLAERMFEDEKINSFTIIDIPSTLLIAYYYLSSKFGYEKVEILNSKKDVELKYKIKDKNFF